MLNIRSRLLSSTQHIIFVYKREFWHYVPLEHLYSQSSVVSGDLSKVQSHFNRKPPQFRKCECAYEARCVKHTHKKWNALRALDTWEICDTADRVSVKWLWAGPKQKHLRHYLTVTVKAQTNGGWPKETFCLRSMTHFCRHKRLLLQRRDNKRILNYYNHFYYSSRLSLGNVKESRWWSRCSVRGAIWQQN